jgi:hypothetical protein
MRSFMIRNRQILSGLMKSSEAAVQVESMGEKGKCIQSVSGKM